MAARPFTTQQNKSSTAEVSADKPRLAEDSQHEVGDEGEGKTEGASAPIIPAPSEPEQKSYAYVAEPEFFPDVAAANPNPDASKPTPDAAATVFFDFLSPENRRQFMEFCRQNHKTPPEAIVMILSMATDHTDVLNTATRQEAVAQRMQSQQQGTGGYICPQCGRAFAGGTTYCSNECGAAARQIS